MYSLELKGDYKSIYNLQEKEQNSLLQKANVAAIGIAHKEKNGNDTGDPSLTFYVESKLDKSLLSADDIIPAEIGKFKTDVVEVGQIYAQSSPTLNDRIRPAKGGFSVGHPDVTAGTLGVAVVDRNPAIGQHTRYYILSNNHVLANSNSGFVGDPIYQPGRIDGGTPSDTIGRLSRFIPIHFLPSPIPNIVDAAIAEVFSLEDLDREIYWKGYVSNIIMPSLGMTVQKTGRTTGHSTGRVIGINVTVNVGYSGGRVARFYRQIMTTDMSNGGDSGSLVMDMNNNAVGLLFAGSSVVTICNYIGAAMNMLRVKFL